MLDHITVPIEDREVATLTAELPESAQDLEEATQQLTRRTGRIVLEHRLQRVAQQSRPPRLLRSSPA